MAWGSDTSPTDLTSITTEQYFPAIALNPGELAHCQVQVDFQTTPTEHAFVSVYTTLDTTSEQWDDLPFMRFRVLNTLDPTWVSFTVSGLYRFRIGVVRDGSSDTLAAKLNYRLDGVSL